MLRQSEALEKESDNEYGKKKLGIGRIFVK